MRPISQVMGAEHRVRALPRRMLQQPRGQREVARVHVALAREGDGRRLGVRTLHEPDRGGERQQALQIRRRAAEVGLQAQAHVIPLGARPLKQLEGGVHVARLLHVDP